MTTPEPTPSPAPQAPTPLADPPKLPFPLHDDETVTGFYRRHWIFLWPYIAFLTAVAILVPAVIAFLMDAIGILEGFGQQAFWVITLLWLAYWGVRLFLAWYRYQNDTWTITNQRLIDARRNNPFNLEVSSADLVNVTDISVQRAGILRTMLDYGDIICQTAGTSENAFRLGGLPQPREVQALIDRERDRERLRVRGVS